MKKTFFYINYWLLSFAFVCVLGCSKGKDGEPGPKGLQGPQGPRGLQGPQGFQGEPIIKSGFIAGTITGALSDNSPVNDTFKCEYGYETSSRFRHNKYGYQFFLERFDSSGTYLSLLINVSDDLKSTEFVEGQLIKYKSLGDARQANYSITQYNETGSDQSSILRDTFSNFKLNESTGVLTADFTWNVTNPNLNNVSEGYVSITSSGKAFTVKGSLSIPLKQEVYRVGNPE